MIGLPSIVGQVAKALSSRELDLEALADAVEALAAKNKVPIRTVWRGIVEIGIQRLEALHDQHGPVANVPAHTCAPYGVCRFCAAPVPPSVPAGD